jgi:hypothetical protein
MNSRPAPRSTQALVKAAAKVLEETSATEQEIFLTLPNGNRISIEIAILPPAEEGSTGAMRARPETGDWHQSA